MLTRDELKAKSEAAIADAVAELFTLRTLRKQSAAEFREQIKEVEQRIKALSDERNDAQGKLPFGGKDSGDPDEAEL